MAGIPSTPALRVYAPEDRIERGIFTAQLLLQGFAVAAVTGKNFYGTKKAVLIRNCNPTTDEGGTNAGEIIYWGGAGVTANTGVPLKPGESISFMFTSTKDIEVMVIGRGILAVSEFV